MEKPQQFVRTGVQNEANVYADVYRLLIGGMVISNVLFGGGIALALFRLKFVPLTTQWIKEQYQWPTLVHGLASGQPVPWMLLATVILILTPMARVVVSIAAFATDRDYKYVVITSVVMLVMGITIILGLLGLE
jgi:uncharacterized membrane protein